MSTPNLGFKSKCKVAPTRYRWIELEPLKMAIINDLTGILTPISGVVTLVGRGPPCSRQVFFSTYQQGEVFPHIFKYRHAMYAVRGPNKGIPTPSKQPKKGIFK